MNANYAFLLGLATGRLRGDMSEERILSDVWAQEPEIRKDTTEWVYAFTMLAYQPLDDAELTAYADFAETDAGQRVDQPGAFRGVRR